MNAEFKPSLAPITDEIAAGEAKTMLDAVKALRGKAPNMYRTMANSEGTSAPIFTAIKRFARDPGFRAMSRKSSF